MNTTFKNREQLSLHELKQKKQALERKWNQWLGFLCALTIFPIALGLVTEHFLSDDICSVIMGVLFMIGVIFIGYSIVKGVQRIWAINDVDREIRKAAKREALLSSNF